MPAWLAPRARAVHSPPMRKASDKNAISMAPQKVARVFTARELGKPGIGRWIEQDTADGAPPSMVDGTVRPFLIAESDSYVRPELYRGLLQRDYDHAPIHRVEIWRHPPSGGFHVRIFDEIK
jgi:hypothetical protein